MPENPDLVIREAVEADAPRIIEIFRAAYGGEYLYPEFYEDLGVRKMILGDDALMLVAANVRTGEVLGTASVILEIGAYSDLVGEFGRLAVDPAARSTGAGRSLMYRRLELARERLHIGIVENRTVHPFSQRISERFGFAPVGFLPMKLQFGGRREHTSIYQQFFGDALTLRRNNPRIIPEAFELATLAFSEMRMHADAIVDEAAAPYPHGGEYEIEELTADGYTSLLRIERGRVRSREVFGPMRLHYGFFKLAAARSNYLIARREGRVVGAIGFTRDQTEHNLRVFELIHLEEPAIQVLLRELERRAIDPWDTALMEIDASAYAPRMQRTLLELGYVPSAYMPGLAFHRVERLDVLKMVRLLKPLWIGHSELRPRARPFAELVFRAIEQQQLLPRIARAMEAADLFHGLTAEQAGRLGGLIEQRPFESGDRIFGREETCGEMYIVLEGELSINLDADEAIGAVGPGECLGEVALLAGGSHSATAIANTTGELGVLTRDQLTGLVRRRPDIGVILYRNLARGLGEKLRRADLARAEDPVDLA